MVLVSIVLAGLAGCATFAPKPTAVFIEVKDAERASVFVIGINGEPFMRGSLTGPEISIPAGRVDLMLRREPADGGGREHYVTGFVAAADQTYRVALVDDGLVIQDGEGGGVASLETADPEAVAALERALGRILRERHRERIRRMERTRMI